MKANNENRKFVAEQIARLSGKSFAPTEPIAVREVVNAVLDSCESPAHCRRVVDQLVREPGNFPEPAVFRAVAEATRSLRSQPDPECLKCSGVGQITTVRGGEYRTFNCACGFNLGCIVCAGSGTYQALVGGVSGATRCDCWDLRPIPAQEVEVSA
jgi:hypothetical protein